MAGRYHRPIRIQDGVWHVSPDGRVFCGNHSGEAGQQMDVQWTTSGQRARKRDLKSEKSERFSEKRTLTTASDGSERGKNNKKPTGKKDTPLPLNVQCSGVSNGVGHSFQLCQMVLGRGKSYNAPPIREKAGMYIYALS